MKIQPRAFLILLGALLAPPHRGHATEGNSCANSIPYGPSKPGDCGEQDGANYFSAYSGNASRTVVDAFAMLDATPSRLSFIRHSNTRLVPMTTSQGRFGREGCWTHSFQWFMRDAGVSSGGQPQVRVGFPDGRDCVFTQDATVNSRWVAAANVTEIVIQDGTEYALHNANGAVYRFQKRTNTNSGGIFYRLESSEDASGNVLTYTYNSVNDTLLRQVTNQPGQWIKLTYENLGAFQQQRVTYGTIPHDEAAGEWRELTVTNTTASRFLTLFYDNDFHNAPALPVAEIEFYDENDNLITGTPFGSEPVYAAGQEHGKAFDGNTATYYRYAYIRNGYVGLDVGEGVTKQVSRIRYFIPTGVVATVASADFVGLNDLGSPNNVVKEVELSHVANLTDPNENLRKRVVYDYDIFTDPSGWFRWGYLRYVNLNPGTGSLEAWYSHMQTHDFTRPLLQQIYDSRVVGNAHNIEYEYDPSGTLGFVKRERARLSGDLVAETDYDGPHKPKAVYPNGRVVKYQYTNNNGTMTKKTDGLGREWNMTYDQGGFGHLSSITDPAGRTTTYTRTELGNPLTITHPDGSVETFTRDSRERVLTHTLSGTGINPRTTTYTRNAQGRVTRVDQPDGTYEEWTYNTAGQPLTHRLRDGGTESWTYNAFFGSIATYQDATGRNVSFDIDWVQLYDGIWKTSRSNGLPWTGLENTEFYYLDTRGRVTQLEHAADSTSAFYTYDNYGNLTGSTDELGNAWSYTYDEFKRVTSATDPLQRVTTYDYSNPGTGCCGASAGAGVKPTLITLPSGKKISFAYDAEWQLIQRTDGFDSPDAATTLWSYDAAGNVSTMLDPLLRQTTYTYNSVDQLLTVTDPLGRTTTHAYDLAGDETQVTRPDGGVITKTYDIMGRLLTSTDPQNHVTAFTYDAAGRPLSIQDARGNTHTHEYDLAGRQTKMIYPDASYEQWTFDAVGRRATARTRAGQVMTSTYNARGFEDSRDWSDGTPDMQFQYEANGRLWYITQTDAANSRYTSIYYEYDAANQMLTENLMHYDPAVAGGSYGATTNHTYDADGNRASLMSPTGEVHYTYTQRNQLKQVLHYTDVLATYSYNADGTLSTKSLLNGTTASHTYDAAGQHTMVNHTGPGGAPLKRRDYLYNNMGNRTAMQHDAGLWDVYGYDAVDQLTSAKYSASNSAGASPASTTTYQYDPVGNRQQTIVTGGANAGTTSYATANSMNQYPGIGGNPLTYDANGNLTAMQNAATPTSPITASYDAQNRLLTATRGSGGGADTMEVVYDPWNRPIYRVINGQRLFYVWDGWNLVGESTDAGYQVGEFERVYVHGAAVDEILTSQQGYGGPRRYHHHDALGSVIALTDDTGALLESYTYDVFGTPKVFDATGLPVAGTQHGNRFLYTGREWIAPLSLYDYRNRVYSAEIGRFLQTDPIGFAGGDVNLYRYVGNRPADRKDPFGHFAIAIPILAIAAVAALVALAAVWPFIAPNIPPIHITPPHIDPAPYVQPYTPPHQPSYSPPTHTPGIPSEPTVPETLAPHSGSFPGFTGTPGSTVETPDQTRTYGPDGYPLIDHDMPHHGHGDHCHDWGRPPGGGPPKNEDRGPPRPPQSGDPPAPSNSPFHIPPSPTN